MANTIADAKIQDRMNELVESKAINSVDINALKSANNVPFKLKLGEEIAIINAAIAIEHIALQAVKLDLGSCWVHHFEIDEVREYFDIPLTHKIITLLTIGYPDESPNIRPRINDITYQL